LHHPNILTIYDVGRDGETAYYAMEWVDGRTLREELRAGGPMESSGSGGLAAVSVGISETVVGLVLLAVVLLGLWKLAKVLWGAFSG